MDAPVNQLETNLKLLKKQKPALAEQLQKCPSTWVFCKTGSRQENNLRYQEMTIHSSSHIDVEVRQWLSQLDQQQNDTIVLIGIGLGCYYEALQPWLHSDPQHRLFVLEPDLSAFLAFCETKLATQFFQDEQTELFPFDGIMSLSSPAKALLYRRYQLSALAFYDQKHPDLVAAIRGNLAHQHYMSLVISGELLQMGAPFYSQFFENLFLMPKTSIADRLFNQFQGIPAIICGAGPSLEKSIPLLKNLENKALIFAGGTAMNALNAHGIIPHFGAGLDPFPTHLARILMQTAFEVPFFYLPRMFHEALNLVQGPLLYASSEQDYTVSKWIEKEMHVKSQEISCGSNVINFTFALATSLGCNPIITVGLDLAYSEGKPYAEGLQSHAVHDLNRDFTTKTAKEDLLLRKDIDGNPVYTLMKWINESVWYSCFAATHKKTLFINATEGGIGFQGIPNIPLEEVVKDLLVRQFDLRGRIHGSLQGCSMKVSSEDLMERLNTLENSLQHCLELFESIHQDFPEQWGQLEEEEMPSELKDKEAALEKEVAYEKLLKVLGDQYQHVATIAPHALKEGPIGRFHFLRHAALLVLSFIQRAKTWKLTLPTNTFEGPATKSLSKIGYQIEGQVLRIHDEELNLHIVADFSTAIEATDTFPDGAKREIRYYANNQLHGPLSHFFPPKVIS